MHATEPTWREPLLENYYEAPASTSVPYDLDLGGYDADGNPHPEVALSVKFHQPLMEAGYDPELTVVEGALHGPVWRLTQVDAS